MDHRFESEKSLGEATVEDNRRRELDKTASDTDSYRQLYVDMLKRLNLPLTRPEPSWRSAPAAIQKETTAPSFPGTNEIIRATNAKAVSNSEPTAAKSVHLLE